MIEKVLRASDPDTQTVYCNIYSHAEMKLYNFCFLSNTPTWIIVQKI